MGLDFLKMTAGQQPTVQCMFIGVSENLIKKSPSFRAKSMS